jgi:AcrR family transcriptional regulator
MVGLRATTKIEGALKRTQAQRSAESDDRLLSAAAEIVATEGYLALTLDRVGERAGFSRGLASRKYGSKDGLVEALIRRAEACVHEQVDAAVSDVSDPLDKVMVLFDRFFELVLSDASVRAYFVLFGAVIANRLGPAGVFEDVQRRFGERIAGLIAKAQAVGSLPADLPTDHAAFMVGSLLAGISIETEMGSFDSSPRNTGPLRANLAAMLRRALGG